MAKIYNFPEYLKSERFMDKANPIKVAQYLTFENPDMPDRVANSMALAMIYSTYLSMVCQEENFIVQDLFTNEFNFDLYDEEKIH